MKMKNLFDGYPIDIILCMLFSLILIPIVLLDLGPILSIFLGLPFIIFIPGYLLIFVLFPSKKTDEGVNVIERIALSFGSSIAIVALIGFGLNYTSDGIEPKSALISILIFIISMGMISFYRWFKTVPYNRFTASFDLSLLKVNLRAKSKLERIPLVIIIALMLITSALFVYVIAAPRNMEKLTEFYVLGIDGNSTNYPRYLSPGENATVTIGLINHEYQTVSYTIEIWLLNQTITYNKPTNENMVSYNNAWFIDKINTTLSHIDKNTIGSWEPQWEYNYTFNITKKGENLTLAFLLFTTPTYEGYDYNKDYKRIIGKKIDSAYEEIYLWMTIE